MASRRATNAAAQAAALPQPDNRPPAPAPAPAASVSTLFATLLSDAVDRGLQVPRQGGPTGVLRMPTFKQKQLVGACGAGASTLDEINQAMTNTRFNEILARVRRAEAVFKEQHNGAAPASLHFYTLLVQLHAAGRYEGDLPDAADATHKIIMDVWMTVSAGITAKAAIALVFCHGADHVQVANLTREAGDYMLQRFDAIAAGGGVLPAGLAPAPHGAAAGAGGAYGRAADDQPEGEPHAQRERVI